MEDELLRKLADKSLTKEELYQKVEQDHSLLPILLKGISSLKAATSSRAIMIQSTAVAEDALRIYVQNVGQGTVKFDPNACVYLDDKQYTADPQPSTFPEGQTSVLFVTGLPDLAGKRVKIKS